MEFISTRRPHVTPTKFADFLLSKYLASPEPTVSPDFTNTTRLMLHDEESGAVPAPALGWLALDASDPTEIKLWLSLFGVGLFFDPLKDEAFTGYGYTDNGVVIGMPRTVDEERPQEDVAVDGVVGAEGAVGEAHVESFGEVAVKTAVRGPELEDHVQPWDVMPREVYAFLTPRHLAKGQETSLDGVAWEKLLRAFGAFGDAATVGNKSVVRATDHCFCGSPLAGGACPKGRTPPVAAATENSDRAARRAALRAIRERAAERVALGCARPSPR